MFPQPFCNHPGAICAPIWARILQSRSPPELVTQEQTLVHLSPKLGGLTKYWLDKLNIVLELGLVTTMGVVPRVEMYIEGPSSPMAHNAIPPTLAVGKPSPIFSGSSWRSNQEGSVTSNYYQALQRSQQNSCSCDLPPTRNRIVLSQIHTIFSQKPWIASGRNCQLHSTPPLQAAAEGTSIFVGEKLKLTQDKALQV